jgi:phosphoribosyl 1,2-cyclic phosphate phosphodiesterase
MLNQNNFEIEAVLLGTGTSQGVPVIGCECPVCQSENEKDKRLRSAMLLKINGQNFVIDAGPDFRQQMLREKVKNLRAILITHEHADHIFGLDDIRSFNWLQKNSIEIYAEMRVQKSLKRIFDYVFTEHKYPGIPMMELFSINDSPFSIDGVEFLPIRCFHHKLPVYGFRVGNLSYITDTNFIPDEGIEQLKGTEILVINALREKKHISHFNLEEALEMIKKIKPEKAFLTHISHEFGFHEKIQSILPPNVFVALDGQKIQLKD